jgi:hypothetical protein
MLCIEDAMAPDYTRPEVPHDLGRDVEIPSSRILGKGYADAHSLQKMLPAAGV